MLLLCVGTRFNLVEKTFFLSKLVRTMDRELFDVKEGTVKGVPHDPSMMFK